VRIPVWLCCAWLCCALLFALPAWAGDAISSSADGKFDRTGDGLVDTADWLVMSGDEKKAYARASLLELGLTPEVVDGNGRTRLQDYLDGLNSVYGR